MPNLNFCLPDRRFGLNVPSRVVDGILSVCGPAAPSRPAVCLLATTPKGMTAPWLLAFQVHPAIQKQDRHGLSAE